MVFEDSEASCGNLSQVISALTLRRSARTEKDFACSWGETRCKKDNQMDRASLLQLGKSRASQQPGWMALFFGVGFAFYCLLSQSRNVLLWAWPREACMGVSGAHVACSHTDSLRSTHTSTWIHDRLAAFESLCKPPGLLSTVVRSRHRCSPQAGCDGQACQRQRSAGLRCEEVAAKIRRVETIMRFHRLSGHLFLPLFGRCS